MRIIAGRLKGRRLFIPKSETRPSTDRVRESLFAVLQGEFEGGRVLDLFAGSGSLGLEALSRGAAEAVFVEQSRRVAEALERNLLPAIQEGLQTRVFKEKVEYYLRHHWPEGGADLVLMDPPYRDVVGPKCLSLLAELHAGELACVAYESAGGEEIVAPTGLEKRRTLAFGDTQVTIFRGGRMR